MALALAAVVTPAAAGAQNNASTPLPRISTGVGPALSGSVQTLPQPALKFIVEYYPDAGITEMDKEYLTGNYEVKFENGTEIEFDRKGNVIDIDADDTIIPENVVRAVVPAGVFRQLKEKNQSCCVESLEKKQNGYKIEVRDSEFFYTDNGAGR